MNNEVHTISITELSQDGRDRVQNLTRFAAAQKMPLAVVGSSLNDEAFAAFEKRVDTEVSWEKFYKQFRLSVREEYNRVLWAMHRRNVIEPDDPEKVQAWRELVIPFRNMG